MNVRSLAGSAPYKSRRGHSDGQRSMGDDWESFLYSICGTIGVQFQWFDPSNAKNTRKLKENTTKTIVSFLFVIYFAR